MNKYKLFVNKYDRIAKITSFFVKNSGLFREQATNSRYIRSEKTSKRFSKPKKYGIITGGTKLAVNPRTNKRRLMENKKDAKKPLTFKNRKPGVIIISSILRPFMRIKLRNVPDVTPDEPAVFICNHGELYGPLSAAVGMPFDFRPWINSPVLSKTEAYDFVFENSMKNNRSLPDFLKVGIAEICRLLGTWALNSYNPIPVSKTSISALRETLDKSVEALTEGDNILIFPENPQAENDGKYNKNGLSAISGGFAHVAKNYFRKTGKILTFYPMFTDKHTHTITFGKAIEFNPDNPPAVEKERLVSLITSSMRELMGEPEEPLPENPT